ncbi:MAG: transketolase [Bacteroidota bacterium]|nr:transketolase [Bacteroidota bacterium]MDX5431031.1 transketolase [Bacteroidota bacterium]MDX5469781.1 transketolase [Bacteroidota bacterium]
MADIQKLESIASQVRRDIVRMVHAVQSGHPGGSLGCADFFTALFFEVMNHKAQPFSMDGKGEDVFILSNGHISPVYYSALARSGYFPVNELATFRKLNSRLQGHPATHEHLPGVRIASGSLGQGLSVAVGIAKSKKMNNDASLVFTLCGDGELQEGQIWEAVMFAAHNKVDNLIITIDANGRQIDGDTKDIMGFQDLGPRFAAFGCEVMYMEGNDMAKTVAGLNEAKSRTGNGKPVVIVMHTEMGYPIDFMVGSHEWHGIAPNDAQLESALNQLEETLGDY